MGGLQIGAPAGIRRATEKPGSARLQSVGCISEDPPGCDEGILGVREAFCSAPGARTKTGEGGQCLAIRKVDRPEGADGQRDRA